MRNKLILYALSKGFHVIGQIRKDTALYDIPERTGKKAVRENTVTNIRLQESLICLKKESASLSTENGNGCAIKAMWPKPDSSIAARFWLSGSVLKTTREIL
jgi:hypothetical protein